MKWRGIKRERAPFSLTPEMAFVLGGQSSASYAAFVQRAAQAFAVVRARRVDIVAMLAALLPAGVRELKSIDDVRFVWDALSTTESFESLVAQSLSTLTTRVMNVTHILAHGKATREKD